MDFSIPASLAPVLDELAAFIDAEVVPLEKELALGFRALEPKLDTLREEAKRRGWWLPQLPREGGGMGLSVLEHGLVSEVLGRTPLGHYVLNCQAPDADRKSVV